ncbi:MAG: hypothetical protein ABJN14_12130 [Paracoccaceae bacterium]
MRFFEPDVHASPGFSVRCASPYDVALTRASGSGPTIFTNRSKAAPDKADVHVKLVWICNGICVEVGSAGKAAIRMLIL